MVILATLILPIHEHRTSFHLFESSSVSFCKVLKVFTFLLNLFLFYSFWCNCASMWVKWNHRPVLHVVKTWGFVFSLGGFIPIPPQIRIPCRDEILEGLPSRCLACSPCSDGTVFWGSWCLQGSSPPTPLLPVAPRRCLLSILSSVPLFVLCPFPTLFSLHL